MNRRSPLVAVILAGLLLLASPCGAQHSPADVSLEGEWEGVIHYRFAPARFSLWDMVETGTVVTGKTQIRGAGPPGPERSVQGTIEGNRLSLSVPSLAYAGYDLIVDGDTITGTCRSTAGEIATLKGTRKRK